MQSSKILVVTNPEDLLPAPVVLLGVKISVTTEPLTGADRHEHCLVSASLLAALHLSIGMQLRVTGPDGNSAVFTIRDTFVTISIPPLVSYAIKVYSNSTTDSQNGGVYKLCGQAGSNASLPFTTCTVANVPVSESTTGSHLTHFYDEPASGSFTEHVSRASDQQLIALFPHGGNIDRHTSDQVAPFASRLAEEDRTATTWECRGTWSGGGAMIRWHITATDIATTSFRGLHKAQFVAHGTTSSGEILYYYIPFRFAVAFHGVTAHAGVNAIVIGGLASTAHKELVRDHIQQAIADAAPQGTTVYYYVANSGVTLPTSWHGIDVSLHSGLGTNNIVNRMCTDGGIQIEQSQAVRDNEVLRTAVARGVAAAMLEILAEAESLGSARPERQP
ncbi:MAG TPA: hypothetical protein VNO30_06915 [Kofleriaceae bacterium]|nr:hypothetical protein [Kofleriaceae bacterium]